MLADRPFCISFAAVFAPFATSRLFPTLVFVSASDDPSRYLIGIDLGTTNSAVAYVDTAEPTWAIDDFAIPQLVAAGQVEKRDVLPSFHYEAADAEFSDDALRLPWSGKNASRAFVGVFARDHGAASTGRLVSSAKSWLSHSGVDRTAGLLPWHGASDVPRHSPVEICSRYLDHIRSAWDAEHPEHPLARQEVVLAVPASFDEVARELTIAAAQRAGFGRVVLVEEPQAAFYAWIDAQGEHWDRQVQAGQTILVCDVGGGTSDFTLIRVRPAEGGRVYFHRVAVGEHLILGGDNLDLALANHVESQLGKGKLDPRQWGALIRHCRQAKELFLGENPPDRLTLSIAATGAKLIGGAVQIELERSEVEAFLLDGFLPHVERSTKPAARRSGFREFGLPFAADPAITRYLASFLTAHGENGQPARPDLLLFNGGLFDSPLLRQRLVEVLTSWFPDPDWSLRVLSNDRPDLAVARGAACFAMVQRGRRTRIVGGLAHSYYLGVEADGPPQAVCLLPAGIEQGKTVDLGSRKFTLRIRQPVEFPLYFSSTQTTDAPGELVQIDPERHSALPPIRTVLQSGPRSEAADAIGVQLHARLTEVGTLEIWCAQIDGAGRWRLQFDVRAATYSDAEGHTGVGESHGVVDEAVLARTRNCLAAAFGGQGDQSPTSIVKRLEEESGLPRADWPPTLLRSLWETLIDVEPVRRRSVEHESRWLSLAGFSLRPGFGMAVDDWRVAQTWRILPSGVFHPKNESCRAEWWILWRRIAGGLSAAQQMLIGEPLVADWRTFLRKDGVGVRGRSPQFQFGTHESAEVWRLLGSLELLRIPLKIELGQIIFARLQREKAVQRRDALLFALGRLGARQPVYGPLNSVLPTETVEEWIGKMLDMGLSDDRAIFAAVQLARRTDDRYRDVSAEVRRRVLNWLAQRGAATHLEELVRAGGSLREEEQRSVFGETLPRGLRIE